jgi:hypothetical protein
MGILVVLYEASDCRCYRGQLVVGSVNYRHGCQPSARLGIAKRNCASPAMCNTPSSFSTT